MMKDVLRERPGVQLGRGPVETTLSHRFVVEGREAFAIGPQPNDIVRTGHCQGVQRFAGQAARRARYRGVR